MKPSNAKILLNAAIAARRPVLFTGAPGIGKTDIVRQVIESRGARMILSHPSVSDPTDFKGLPWPGADASHATFLPFGEFAEALNATTETVWVLDDLGQASPAVQAAAMQLLLARRVNGHVLPDCVTFVAMTNGRTHRANVSGILEPVKSRFATIVELQPDVDEWCTWLLTEQTELPTEIAAMGAAYMRFQPASLSKFTPTADLTNSPSPRTWTNALRVLSWQMPSVVETESVAGSVGEADAVAFLGFIRLFRELPSIDAILIDPNAAPIPTQPGTLYAVTTALATRVTPTNFGRIARYAHRLWDGKLGDFGALLVRDCLRRDPAVTQTADFAQLAAGPLGKLMAGEI